MPTKVVNLITILTILATTTCTSENTWNWEDDMNIDDIQEDKWIFIQKLDCRRTERFNKGHSVFS